MFRMLFRVGLINLINNCYSRQRRLCTSSYRRYITCEAARSSERAVDVGLAVPRELRADCRADLRVAVGRWEEDRQQVRRRRRRERARCSGPAASQRCCSGRTFTAALSRSLGNNLP